MSESAVTEEVREEIAAALGPLMGEEVEDLRLEDLEDAVEAMQAVRSRAADHNRTVLVKATEHVMEQVREELVRRQRERHQHDKDHGRRD